MLGIPSWRKKPPFLQASPQLPHTQSGPAAVGVMPTGHEITKRLAGWSQTAGVRTVNSRLNKGLKLVFMRITGGAGGARTGQREQISDSGCGYTSGLVLKQSPKIQTPESPQPFNRDFRCFLIAEARQFSAHPSIDLEVQHSSDSSPDQPIRALEKARPPAKNQTVSGMLISKTTRQGIGDRKHLSELAVKRRHQSSASNRLDQVRPDQA